MTEWILAAFMLILAVIGTAFAVYGRAYYRGYEDGRELMKRVTPPSKTEWDGEVVVANECRGLKAGTRIRARVAVQSPLIYEQDNTIYTLDVTDFEMTDASIQVH